MCNGTFKKRLAAVIAAVMLGSLITGCGKSPETEQDNVPLEKGRYVEKEMTLPDGLAAADIAQVFRKDSRLHMLVKKDNGGTSAFQEWELSDGSFQEVTEEWLKQISIPYREYSSNKLLYGKDGIRYFFAAYPETEEGGYKGHLWKSGDGSAPEEITPEGWTVPDEEYGFYNYPQDLTVLDDGTLVGNMYWKIEYYQAGTGSLVKEITLENSYLEKIASSGDKYYLMPTDSMGKISGIDIYSADSDVPQQSLEVVVESSTSTAYLDILPDGTMVLFNGDGIFRSQTGSGWETVIEGVDTSVTMTNIWCKGMAALEDGSYYAVFGGEDGDGALMEYIYDAEAVNEVTQTLTVYSVEDSFLLQQAAASFHKAHPEVMVTIETALTREQMYESNIDYQQIFQTLNTRLMSGKGPDVLVMDHLNMESFMEKGLLVDIDDVVKPLEEDGTLLSNVTGAYVREDGSRYVVPLQFGIVLAVGRQLDMEQMKDIPSMAAALSQTQESLMGPLTPYELAERFLPYLLEDIIDGKTLDKEALKTNLESLKAIGDNSGIIDSRGEDERAWNIWEVASKSKLAFYETDGFNQAMLPISVANYVKGSYIPFADSFHPSLQVGIYSKTQQSDLAKEFLAFLMSEEIQSHDYYEGFPVNSASLEMLAAKDRSNAEAETMIEVGEGMSEVFQIKSYDEADAKKLMDTCRQVTKVAKMDNEVLDKLAAALPGYLDGTQTIDETVEKIDGGLRMYLAE